MKDTALLVMAAGMGSRFGGLKQMEPFGKNGETILDYSVFDALDAGFNKIVLVIKKSIEKDFREHVGKRLEAKADVEYVFQELDKLYLQQLDFLQLNSYSIHISFHDRNQLNKLFHFL